MCRPEIGNPYNSAPITKTKDIEINDNDDDAEVVGTPAGNNSQSNNDDKDKDDEEDKPSCWKRLVNFYWKWEFMILVVLAICLARAYPPLGAEYLAPHITATWIAVVFIFVMAGLSLKTEEFANALKQIKFNLFVQIFNFGVVSATVYGVSRGLILINAINQNLADGMVVCASLPLTINMVCVLTKSAGGDEAAAIFNAAFGNAMGVFLSPLLILGYLGVTGDVNMGEVFFKLFLRVILPVIVGQLLQKFSKRVVRFVKKHKPKFKALQQYTLVFIIYTVFCRTFNSSDSQAEVGDIFLMILFQLILLIFFMILSWNLLRLFFRDQPELRVMGLFGCTHKTVAMGVPLINAIYESSPYVAQYTLPLLIWHPMQLIIGTFLVPRLLAFVAREHERLGITNNNNDKEDNDDNNNKDNSNKDVETGDVTEKSIMEEEGEDADKDQEAEPKQSEVVVDGDNEK